MSLKCYSITGRITKYHRNGFIYLIIASLLHIIINDTWLHIDIFD